MRLNESQLRIFTEKAIRKHTLAETVQAISENESLLEIFHDFEKEVFSEHLVEQGKATINNLKIQLDVLKKRKSELLRAKK